MFIATKMSGNILWQGPSLIIMLLLSLKTVIIKSIALPISHRPLETITKMCF